LLLSVFVGNAAEGHFVESLHFGKALFSGCNLDLLPHFVALLLVPFPNVLFVEALLIFDHHVDRVVHEAVTKLVTKRKLTSGRK
jgi:hypothetical protein